MNSISHLSRTTSLMQSSALLRQLGRTQAEMFKAQTHLSTGQTLLNPSDDPSRVSTVLYLEQMLAQRAQQEKNLMHGLNMMNTADQALGDAADIVREAVTVASSQIGIGSDTQTRKAEALVIDAHLQGMLDIVNRQYAGVSAFGGNNGAASQGQVFAEFLGGIRYVGGIEDLQGDLGSISSQMIAINGLDALGAFSTRVRSEVDLVVQSSDATELRDLAGAQGQGIRPGAVRVSVDGQPLIVDLTQARSMEDVRIRINAAIAEIAPGAGQLALHGAGFALQVQPGHSVAISDLGAGQTATDLGIALGGVAGSYPGADLAPRLTPLTRISDLGTSVDWSSGLQITQGNRTDVADFSGAQTVEDLMNVVEQLGVGLRLQINAQGTGLDLLTEVSGVALSIGENGGSTAEDLGLRTLGLQTPLTAFRNGAGVISLPGEPDLSVQVHDGRSFEVNLDGAITVGDVISLIEAAATAAGLTPGVDLSVGMEPQGNGLRLIDHTSGSAEFSIANVGLSLGGDHLGLTGSAGSGNTLSTGDQAQVRIANVFTHLMDLRDALTRDDTSGITLAGGNLEADLDALVQVRAVVGIQAKRIEDQQVRSAEQTLADKSTLSLLRDADLTEVITRFQQLQLQLQASMAIGSQNLQMSLLNFLG